jgi:DNA repair photolyase
VADERGRSCDAVQQALFDAPVGREIGIGEYRGLEFIHVQARRIINQLKTPGPLPFSHTVNAYRGCSHACTYCFARPTHAYLELDPATEFDSVIVVKVNAVERMRAELAPSRWAGETVAMGTNTDPYQRADGRYHLTEGIIDVLTEHANPFSILTKGTLILRDLERLVEAARRTDVRTAFSIGTLDESVWRATEPGTPHPARRMEAVARLNDAGVRCDVALGPIIPGLSDRTDQLEAVVRGAIEAGARSLSPIVLHLRPGVREHWLRSLANAEPDLAAEHAQRYRGTRLPAAEREEITERVRALEARWR